MIFKGRVVWIPCKIIEGTEGETETVKFVQPLDGWEKERLWSSNWREIDDQLEINLKIENKQLKLELKEQKAEFGDWFNYPKSCEKLIIENDRLNGENEILKLTIMKLKDELDNPQTMLSGSSQLEDDEENDMGFHSINNDYEMDDDEETKL